MEHMAGEDLVSDYLDTYYEILGEMERGMTAAPRTASISGDFITRMIPHHRAAVEMCENVLRYAVGEPVRDLARTIIRQQTRGIGEMEAILCPCEMVRNGPQAVRRYLRCGACIMSGMFSAMAHVSGVGVEQNFLREMIPHHEGAVHMCENALRFHICPPLRPILENIIVTQEREIGEMRRLLAEERT